LKNKAAFDQQSVAYLEDTGTIMRPKTSFSHDLCEARSSPKSYAIHSLGVLEATRVLESNVEHGLSVEEAIRRQQKFGPNRIVTRHGTPGWRRFLKQFTEPLIYVLIAAAAITAWLASMWMLPSFSAWCWSMPSSASFKSPKRKVRLRR
jgi:magnesium-transporting ATPase (P-type)